MSLLKDAMEEFIMLDKTTIPDGMGGYIQQWTDGAVFLATAVLNSSMQARIAEKLGVTNLYTITTQKNIHLEYHDVLRRKSDGKIFRVTSDGDDNATPETASINMRQVNAEEWRLPV